MTSYSSVDWEVVASGYNPVAPNDFFGNILPRGTVSFEPSRFQSQDMEKIYIYLNKDSPSLISSEDKTFDVILTNPSPGSEIKSGISPGLILTRNTDRIFTPIDGQLGDGFGSSSALSRDGRSLIIGGPRDDVDGRSEQGSAYVFFLEWGSVDSTRLNFNSI